MYPKISKAGGPKGPPTSPLGFLAGYAMKLIGLGMLDAIALWFLSHLYNDQVWFMFTVIGVITIGINLVFLVEKLYPFQWLSPGLALMILLVVYPVIFTIYTAFTNYGTSNLLTKKQVITALESEQYISANAPAFSWTAFRSPEGYFAIWFISPEGKGYLGFPGKPLEQPLPGQGDLGALDENGVPVSLIGYERLSRAQSVKYLTDLTALQFGTEPGIITISSISKAAQYQQKYTYIPEQDQLLDNETGIVYKPADGNFTSPDGTKLNPGFQVGVGLKNFIKLSNTAALRGPILLVFSWTIGFALFSVLFSFAVGLFISVTFQNALLPSIIKKGIRSILLLPYAIPFFLSVLIWRGLFNQSIGVINRITEFLFHWSAPWFNDPWWAKVAIIIINIWLMFPYMMLITTGSLQSIPSDLYEAAEVDGASSWQRFWKITLPLLLVSVGPLLVFSFAGTFNNFGLIFLYNRGGPPVPNTPTPIGHTDILISYVYNLAFGTSYADYAYASTITIVIFIIVAIMTIVQFKYTKVWEEV
jgi:arabinogalactan oligomer / maltooligosaccharide transport system permease protein